MLVFSSSSSSSSQLFCFFFFLLHNHNHNAAHLSLSLTTEFDFGTLTLTSLRLLGDAHLTNATVRLTRDLPVPNSAAGTVLYSKPVRFTAPCTFSTFFSFSVTNLNPSSIGAGLAFVILPDSHSIGPGGASFGLTSGFVAVEFDTQMDVQFNDINGNHVGLDLNTLISAQVADLDAVDVDLKSGDLINSWIDYDGSTRVFNVWVSYSNLKPKEPMLSIIDFDLHQYVNDFMYVGFSASTQGSTEIHSIEWWSFSASVGSNPPPPLSPTTNTVKPPPPSLAPAGANSVSGAQQQKSGSSKSSSPGSISSPGAVAGVVTAGAFFLGLFAGVLIWFYSKKKKKEEKRSVECFGWDVIKMPKEFSYKELKTATKCFNANRVIGHGAFGTVYKGILPDNGDIIAVKRCSHSSQGKKEFVSELSIIGTLRHRNLVRLQGWCHEKGEILLVYDLMENGSLDKALFESRTILAWAHRRKILVGVASALAYLHQECENQVIHRDVKSSNIMLDEWFNAKLGDFGLAREVEHDKSPDATVAAGTMGYLAPEYVLTGRATEKTDVFSYGAVVLEVASGRRPIEKEKSKSKSNLVEWVWSLHREGRVLVAADSRLEGGFEEGEMRKVLLVGLACSHPDPAARPTMRGVVQMLVGDADAADVPIIVPPRPAKPAGMGMGMMSFSTSHLLLSLQQDSVSDCNAGMITLSTTTSESESESEASTAYIMPGPRPLRV